MTSIRTNSILLAAVIGCVAGAGFLSLAGNQASAKAVVEMTIEAGNPDLEMLIAAPAGKKSIDEARAIYRTGGVTAPVDYYNAAKLLSKSESIEDQLLAHDLAVAACVMGNHHARSLVAETEDKFLIALGKPQRFGTQKDKGSTSKILTEQHKRIFLNAGISPMPVPTAAVID